MDALPFFAVAVVALAAIFVVAMLAVVNCYKRCASNQIMVVYGNTGKGHAARTIHGGGTFVWPVIQQHQYLSLEPIQIEIPLREVISSENIRVNAPSVFTVAIGTQPEMMAQAAIRLLGLSVDQIRKQAEEIIIGQLRQAIASMGIEEINRDWATFLKRVQGSLETKLSHLGLTLINVNIPEIEFEHVVPSEAAS